MPECTANAAPRRVSRRGGVITFLVPSSYSHRIAHDAIINRGPAPAVPCTAIADAGHSVEIRSEDAGILPLPTRPQRCCGVAQVISARGAFPGRRRGAGAGGR
ncbi:hypothetical protein GCM10009634_79890 [Saccharothrix xinjiangensis]